MLGGGRELTAGLLTSRNLVLKVSVLAVLCYHWLGRVAADPHSLGLKVTGRGSAWAAWAVECLTLSTMSSPVLGEFCRSGALSLPADGLDLRRAGHRVWRVPLEVCDSFPSLRSFSNAASCDRPFTLPQWTGDEMG